MHSWAHVMRTHTCTMYVYTCTCTWTLRTFCGNHSGLLPHCYCAMWNTYTYFMPYHFYPCFCLQIRTCMICYVYVHVNLALPTMGVWSMAGLLGQPLQYYVCSVIETRQSKATTPKDNSSLFPNRKRRAASQLFSWTPNKWYTHALATGMRLVHCIDRPPLNSR